MPHQFYRTSSEIALTKEQHDAIMETRTRPIGDDWLRNDRAASLRQVQAAGPDPFSELFGVEGDSAVERKAKLVALLAARGVHVKAAS